MTKIDEKLNKSLSKSTYSDQPVREVYDNGDLARIYYNHGLEIDLKNKEIELFGTLNLKTIKILVEKWKELGWI
jgi:hypothetical protein